MKILLLEDRPEDVLLIERTLKEAGLSFDITAVHDAAGFHDALRRSSPDVILSDFRLPGYDGLQALEYAKAHNHEVPFILVSGTIGEEKAIEALKAGADDYVMKQRPQRLGLAIEQALAVAEERLAAQTAAQEYERVLLGKQSQLDEAQELADLGSWETNLKTGVTTWSENLFSLMGMDPAVVTPSFELLLEHLHPDDRAKLEKAAHGLLASGQPFAIDFRVVRTDQSLRVQHARGRLVYAEDGSPERICGIAHDVTGRVAAEEARGQLMKSQKEMAENFRLILESTGEGVYGMNVAGRCTFVNPAAAALLGYTVDEILGKNMHELIHNRHEDGSPYPANECPLRHATDTGTSIALEEETLWRKDGKKLYVDYLANCIKQEGAITGLVVSFRDITDRLNVVAEREKTMAALRTVVDERSGLLTRLINAQEAERTRIAGDLHDDSIQVMASVAMRLGLLQRRPLDDESRRLIDRLDETVGLAIKRLRRLLFDLRPPALDREGLIPALRLYLAEDDRASNTKVVIEDRLDREPGPIVRATLYRIAQEAFTNVRKHANADNVNVLVQNQEDGTLLTISDDGVGFDQSDDVTHASTGHLGLDSMRERAEALGGWCQITSATGTGTRLRCWIPPGEAA